MNTPKPKSRIPKDIRRTTAGWERDMAPLHIIDQQREGWKVEHFDENYPLYTARRLDGKESYFLSNRPFELIDRVSNHKILAMLIKQLKQHPDRDVRVLDIGGGVYSVAVRDMLRHPMLKDRIRCASVDLFAEEFSAEDIEDDGIDPKRLRIIRGDFLEQPTPEKGFDLILSWEALNHVPGPKLYPMLEKAAAMLSPGGEFIARDDRIAGSMERWVVMPLPEFPQMEGFDDFQGPLQMIANKHDVLITPSFCQEKLNGTVNLMGAGHGLLLMRKGNPEDPRDALESPRKYDAAYPELKDAVQQHRRWWEE